MNRAVRAFLIFASVVSALIGLTGYGVVLVTTDIHLAVGGFVALLFGLCAFIICMHAWTDLS